MTAHVCIVYDHLHQFILQKWTPVMVLRSRCLQCNERHRLCQSKAGVRNCNVLNVVSNLDLCLQKPGYRNMDCTSLTPYTLSSVAERELSWFSLSYLCSAGFLQDVNGGGCSSCWSVLEQDTEPPVHCSLITKDGSNAEKNFPIVGSIKCTLLIVILKQKQTCIFQQRMGVYFFKPN